MNENLYVAILTSKQNQSVDEYVEQDKLYVYDYAHSSWRGSFYNAQLI